MQSISNGSQYKAVRGDAVLVIANILLISPCLKGRRFVFAASPSSCIERTPSVGFFLIFFEDQPLEKSCDCRLAAPAGGDQIKQSRATFHNLSLCEFTMDFHHQVRPRRPTASSFSA